MAVSSMTGFGAAQRAWSKGEGGPARGAPTPPARVSAELRAVNARFLELKLRQPFGPEVEAALRRRVEARIGRGRVELRITLHPAEAGGSEAPGAGALVPGPLWAQLRALAGRAREEGVELLAVNPLELLNFLSGAGEEVAQPEAPPWLGELVDEALEACLVMRRDEGAALGRVLGDQLDALTAHRAALGAIANGEPERLTRAVQDRLEAAVAAMAGALTPARDELLARVGLEVAALLVRGDVAEELDRIDSHLGQARATLAAPAARGQGKTLDFLSQELLREFTTAGSKLANPAAGPEVIAAKGVIERFREQVQNVE